MPLDFIRTHVEPGDPVTAEAWNAMVDGLFDAQAVLKAAAGVGHVRLTGQGLDPQRARVTATREGAPPVEALRPVGAEPDFIFPRLAEGAYAVHAEAPGFNPADGALTVSATGEVTPDPLELALTAVRPAMPNVLGLMLPQAVQALAAVKIRILDVTGKSLPTSGFPADYNDNPVLMQWPSPGELAPPAGTDALVVVSAQVAAEIVTVPNLSGLSVAQATAELDKVGLKLQVVESGGRPTI
ncbi:MAG TPA: PASTA domain-containing protein [Longimicrobium sp.]